MDLQTQSSKILYTNAKYFGIALEDMYLEAGEKIASKLINKFGISKSYSFVCGLGGNAGDGIGTLIHLEKKGVKDLSLYLIGRNSQFEDLGTSVLFQKLNKTNIKVQQDCFADDIKQPDVLVECLVGTGLVGEKLNKRFLDVIKRISHFNSKLIAIDKPAPSYKPDIVYSLIYPKTVDAEVIEINIPKELTLYPGPGEVDALVKPKSSTYKTKNGKLLYVCNTSDISELELILKVAKTYLVNVLIYNLHKNFEPKDISKLLTNYEIINDSKLDEAILETDTIFFGNFDETSLINRALIYEVMRYKGRKYVLFGDSINYINPNDLTDYQQLAIIPLKDQVQKFLKSGGSLRSVANDYRSCFVELGLRTTIYSNTGDLRFGTSGSLIKKSNQDFLSILIAVLSTKNDIWLSMRAGLFLTELLVSKEKVEDYELLREVLAN